MSGPAIAVVDYGMGNRRSVEKALDHVGARASITRDHDEICAADGVVVPGVGAFPRAMDNLRELGLDAVIHEAARDRVPVLGICLGMQLLFDSSVELGGAAGLGLLPGEVRRLEPGAGRKLPHIGWNLVTLTRPSPLTHGLPDACAFYHVHTFVPVPAREDTLVGTSEYGETFASIVADPEAPVFGVQFHPEKSSAHGLALLENFARVCAPVAA